MTFLFDVVAEYLGRTLVWLAAEAVVAFLAAAAVVALLTTLDRPVDRKPVALASVIGALVAASVVDRFELPVAFGLDVWRTPVPVIWSFAGAAVAALVWALWPRREAASS